jgi:hypothetical protein
MQGDIHQALQSVRVHGWHTIDRSSIEDTVPDDA